MLATNEDHGGLACLSDPHLNQVLAGAVLMDLALENRIDMDPETDNLILVDPAPVGDDLLDPALAELAQAEQTQDAGWWVRHIACSGLFESVLTSAEQREVGGRIEVARRMEPIGRAVVSAVRESAREAAAASARAAPKEIPFAAGLPILGSALEAAGDVGAFLARQYRTLGPVFGVRLMRRSVLVLAGAEANRFLNRKARLFLRPYEPGREFGFALGASRTMLSMDGRDHVRTRSMSDAGGLRGLRPSCAGRRPDRSARSRAVTS